ncbi:hypothetical protein CCACVL1_26556 [Corchorus capsularis]|uniref:Protein PHLOEM PROTEIN 2-LIKE A10 n=1 Tax=Corchorus capsularis TaxID=210143 RepID=A0A1R3GEC8_COCAP|nr:hypothetical protein CCACVL1_26556 [Corchorus capsularis]
MDLQLALKGLEFSRKKKKWVVLLAAFGLTSYGFYRVYQFPAISQKRKRVSKLLGALISMAEAASECAETIGVVSKDMKHFLQSESDQIPNSLKQVSKITKSTEFSDSIVRVSQALTVGIKRGYQSEGENGNSENAKSSSTDQVMDKLFTKAGANFASVVVGSFARNMVMALYSADEESKRNPISSEKNIDVPNWVNVVCGDKCRDLIGDCIQLFVSTMVSEYLEKIKDVNTYDELFAGLTNPKHGTEVKDVLVTVCNNAVETLVRTSHQVLTSSKLHEEEDGSLSELVEARDSIDEDENDIGWVKKVSSTLAEPSNRKFVLDVTGTITFETVRSFLEVLLETLYLGMKKSVNVVHESVVESGHGVVRYVTAKSSVVATICLSLCLHILGGVWILVPA